MSNIKLEIKNSETQVSFQVDGAQEGHITQVIGGMFLELAKGKYGIVHMDEPKAVQPVTPAPVVPVQPVQPVAPVQSSVPDKTAVSNAPAVNTRQHQPNNTTLAVEPENMDEALKVAVPDNSAIPSHFKTGYKVKDDGTKLFKTRYRCPKCKNAGNHYVPEGTTSVDCHGCQTTMQVKKATPGTQGIQPDKFMNWYVAGDQLPVSEFVYGQAKKVN
ncbi:hypothetical protein B5V90_02510 [Heyndrickxia sporothermodurans]|nr:hypothetical protein B5V90_02510 [Heyndrickxia sporothermodurans]